jgi:formylglycine-generating enzyme
LESAPSLTNAPWTLVPEQAIVSDATYNVTNLASQPTRFYRLTSAGNTPASPPGMALIPAGTFTMGNCMDPAEGWASELPLHSVYVSAFYIDRTEVTKAQWDEVYQWATTNGYSFDFSGLSKGLNHPIFFVNWHDCLKWCNARSEKEGLRPAYYVSAVHDESTIYRISDPGWLTFTNECVEWNAGYRLPTEAEWEKAARGGASGHRFPWAWTDNITHALANYFSTNTYPYDTSPTRGFHPDYYDGVWPFTSPVGSFAPNGYGLYDMAGNVEELCWDGSSEVWYSNPGASEKDPHGPAEPLFLRVSRGGDYQYGYYGGRYDSYWSRCASRRALPQDMATSGTGFRCVRPR